jgi:hypothetical protein
MPRPAATARQADAKGRITLGPAFANRTVLVEDRGDEIVLRLGRVIPEAEAWLYENPKALASLRAGLEQARKGKFGPGPDLKSAADLARRIPEE